MLLGGWSPTPLKNDGVKVSWSVGMMTFHSQNMVFVIQNYVISSNHRQPDH